MPELPAVTGRQAIDAFRRIGFEEARIRGSHHVLKKPGHLYVLTIPVHGNTPLKPGTLRRLIDGAGISVGQFTELL